MEGQLLQHVITGGLTRVQSEYSGACPTAVVPLVGPYLKNK
jgi:hypothetical protein